MCFVVVCCPWNKAETKEKGRGAGRTFGSRGHELAVGVADIVLLLQVPVCSTGEAHFLCSIDEVVDASEGLVVGCGGGGGGRGDGHCRLSMRVNTKVYVCMCLCCVRVGGC